MPTSSAEYQRAYRKKRKEAHTAYDEAKPLIGQLKTRVWELEEEVKRLKAELARRPMVAGIAPRPLVVADSQAATRFNSQPFSGPIPKVKPRG